MSVFTDLVALVRRPSAPASAAAKGSKGRPPLLAETPATEPELLEALAKLEAERRVAEDASIEAANRRERLLLEPSEDDAIHAAGRDLDAAQLLLERLDRIEPDLRQRLQDLRDAARAARWIKVRDEYVAVAEAHLADLRAFEAAHRPAFERARAGMLEEFGAAIDQWAGYPVPFVPRFLLPAPDGADTFAASLERLRGIEFNPKGKVDRPFVKMGDVIAETVRSGVMPPDATPEMRRAFGLETRVRFTEATRDGGDVPRQAGEVVTMTVAEGQAEIESGRAVRMEG